MKKPFTFDVFMENQRDRFFLWTPVFFALGIALYFFLSREPPIKISLICGAGFSLIWILSFFTDRLFVRFFCWALVLMGAGFFMAQGRTYWVEAPSLSKPMKPTLVTGILEEVKETEHGKKIFIKVGSIEGLSKEHLPKKIQLVMKLKADTTLMAGDFVELKAKLLPITGPVIPGGLDFRRKAFFNQIGATGYVLHIKQIVPHQENTFQTYVSRIRHHLTQNIHKVLKGQEAAIATCLVAGESPGISQETRRVFADTGTSHILVIAGLHLGLIGGFFFLLSRLILGLFPPFLLRFSLRKCSGFLALVGSFIYLHISGAAIPTQRAFITFSIVMGAVIFDRNPLSMRLVSIAAMIILVLTPEALTTASFQLSFAAVVGLIASYERSFFQFKRFQFSPLLKKIMAYGVGIFKSSLVSSLATLPFTIFHFHKFTLQSVTGNGLAIPLVGAWIMPMGLLSTLCSFSETLQTFFLKRMGEGIVVMEKVIIWCSELPGSAIYVPQISLLSLSLVSWGGLWLCLWRYRLRWLGIPIMAVGVALVFTTEVPRVFVSGDVRTVGVAEGEYFFVSSNRTDTFLGSVWSGFAGIKPDHVRKWREAPQVQCLDHSCLFKTKELTVGYLKDLEHLDDFCESSNILISEAPLRGLRKSCKSPQIIIDRFDVWKHGAQVIFYKKGKLFLDRAAHGVGQRPWTQGRHML
jgi:competence protein ComEC